LTGLSLPSYLATGSAGERGAYNYGEFCKFQLVLLNILNIYVNTNNAFSPFSAQEGKKKRRTLARASATVAKPHFKQRRTQKLLQVAHRTRASKCNHNYSQ
jgi:hypothetical protein